MTGIPEGAMLAILTAIGVVAWWGIRRIVSGQDQINLTLTGISEDIAVMNSRMSSVEAWARAHEKQDDTLFSESRQDRRDLWSVMRKKD